MTDYQTEFDGPEVLPNQPGLEVRPKSRHHYNYESVNSYYRDAYSAPRKRGSTSCGIGNGAIGFLAGFFCSMIIVGASVGGGLGSRLASCENQVKASTPSPANIVQSASTTTTSSSPTTSPIGLLTNYAPPAASTIDTLQHDCTASTVTNIWGDKFVIACGSDYQQGAPAAEGGLITDIAAIYAYTVDDCLSACSGINSKPVLSDLGFRCRSVTFGLDMRNSSNSFWSNCWMKNGSMADPAIAFKDVHRISAKLVT